MNTDELKKLYRDVQNDAAPDFWDKIDAGLKPHAELTEEEANAFSEFEETETTAAEEFRNENETIQNDKTPLKMNQYRKKGSVGGWIAAAAVITVCIPAILLLKMPGREQIDEAGTAKTINFNIAAAETQTISVEVTETEEITVAAAESHMDAAAAPVSGTRTETDSFNTEEVDLKGNAGTGEKTAAGVKAAGYAQLLTVPANAVTVPADSAFFTEEVLAETDMLAMAAVEDAEFAYDAQGRAYQMTYNVTVRESLLEEGESGKAGSKIRICSPIVSDGVPGGKILYQLVPGETYILPLKKNNGEWELIGPTAPQIRLHEDGSFEFHTGYTDLINENTEVVFDTQSSDDDFWFDRKVSRSDPDFIPELTELVKFEKKSK